MAGLESVTHPSDGVAKPSTIVDFVREAPPRTVLYDRLWRRPKDLAGRTEGLDFRREACPPQAERRSFGRAQILVWLLATRGALPQEVNALA